jgi:hypothetical protein
MHLPNVRLRTMAENEQAERRRRQDRFLIPRDSEADSQQKTHGFVQSKKECFVRGAKEQRGRATRAVQRRSSDPSRHPPRRPPPHNSPSVVDRAGPPGMTPCPPTPPRPDRLHQKLIAPAHSPTCMARASLSSPSFTRAPGLPGPAHHCTRPALQHNPQPVPVLPIPRLHCA